MDLCLLSSDVCNHDSRSLLVDGSRSIFYNKHIPRTRLGNHVILSLEDRSFYHLNPKLNNHRGGTNPCPTTNPNPYPKPRCRRKGKKEAVVQDSTKKGVWTSTEERCLAECWINVSQDSNVGNSQSGDAFWTRVQDQFNTLTGLTRNRDQLTSKWRTLSLKVGKFNGIFCKLNRDRPSGARDEDIMRQALAIYKEETNTDFGSYGAWDVLKGSPKWLTHPLAGLKKKKQRAAVEDEDEDLPPVNLDADFENEIFGEDTIPRPAGKGRKEKVHKSSSTSDTSGRSSSVQTEILERLDVITGMAVEKKKTIIEKMEELKFLTVSTAGIEDEVDRRAILEMKRQIREKHNIN